MSKISEQKALEEYPKETYYDRDVCDYVDVNATRRDGFIKGYDQAMKDFLEKAEGYLKNTLYDRVEICAYGTLIPSLVGKTDFIEQFKNYMKNESEN